MDSTMFKIKHELLIHLNYYAVAYETTQNGQEVVQAHCRCSGHGSTNHFSKSLLWHVLDWLL